MATDSEADGHRTSYLKIFLIVLVFTCTGLPALFVLRTLLIQPFNIPSASNEPNLMVGDYILVSKAAYGYSRYSFSPFNVFSFAGRTGHNLPERGDVVVFKYPQDVTVDYIKRVVGLPGDHIQMVAGVLNINGVPVKLEPADLPTEFHDMDGIKFFRETLPGGRSYIVSDLGATAQDNTVEYIVPAQHYFMLGDARDNSVDSRFLDKVGYVPEENIVGPVLVRLFNVNGHSVLKRPAENYSGQ